MDLFSINEIMMMAGILGGMILIIAILTILDFFDSRREKKIAKQSQELKVVCEEKQLVKEEIVEPVVNIEEALKQDEFIEEIEILDFDEPIIEMKEELNNNEVNVSVLEEQLDEVVQYEEVAPYIEEESNIIEITDEKTRAKEELARLEEELQKEESFENTITNFEIEQEESAIISYDELLKISDSLYEQNEVVQYDDGDEPITIDEVIKRFSSNEMVFENTANLDKLNREIEKKDTNFVEAYKNE